MSISYVTVTGYTTGLYIDTEIYNETGYTGIHFNNIYNNTINVIYRAKSELDASKNFWGYTSKDRIIEKIDDGRQDLDYGIVHVSPWSTHKFN